MSRQRKKEYHLINMQYIRFCKAVVKKPHTDFVISDLECGQKPISRKPAYQPAERFNIDAGRFI